MIIFGVSYLLIMAAFLTMAIQAFLAVLEYYLITAVAGVLVPWALLPQTKFLAEKAIGAVVSAGIKLMVLAFIIAVTNPVLASIHFSGPEIKLNELWSVLLTTGAIAFLSWHAPSLAAGLLAGSPSLAAGAVAQNLASGAMMAAGVAGGMVAATRAAAGAIGTLTSHRASTTDGAPSTSPAARGGTLSSGFPSASTSRVAISGAGPDPARPGVESSPTRSADGVPPWVDSARTTLEVSRGNSASPDR
jgi:type IV secretion system protein TrbL